MQQIVDYKNEPGNGYGNSLLCFMQLFIVSNANRTLYFANNKNQHFAFNADEQFLPVYELADIDNKKINGLTDKPVRNSINFKKEVWKKTPIPKPW